MLLKDVLSGKLPAPAAGKPDKLRAVGTQNLKTPASRAPASPQAEPTAAAAPHEAAHPHSEPQSSESMPGPPPFPPPDVEAGLDGSAVPGSPSQESTAVGAATLAAEPLTKGSDQSGTFDPMDLGVHTHSNPQSSESMPAPPRYPPPDVEAGLDGSAVPGSPSPKFTAIGAATLAPRLCRVVSCRVVSCRFGAGFLLCDL